jgi:Protein of unknown function (DUF1444)
MEREPQGGSDYGLDHRRDMTDETPGAIRDTAPDLLAPIDETAPVSGHVVAPESTSLISESPEHDWQAAASIIYPALRPVGTQGLSLPGIDPAVLAADAGRSHSQPLLDEGPAGLPVVYTLNAGAYDVIVNADHLLSWGVTAADLQDKAMANLRAWSATAAWTDEVSGERRLLSSDTGDGWDATRILLPEVQQRLTSELGSVGRVLVGLPERHLLVAGALRPGDEEFVSLFAEFIVEQSGGADEPIDRRVFELVDGHLVEFTDVPASG